MFKTMMPTTQDRAVRRRPHVGGDHGSSTHSPVIGTIEADGAPTELAAPGPKQTGAVQATRALPI
jgi:hypothetical protein